ncbi:hypothetical protein OEZ85_012780 [Tetradesmus obliquus]|uniref:Glycoside hydrolase family 5 domain-containing protein n=1 Tax=Tetradesmus obliquus TaxID=3088 RepID=A0ABY8U8T8_TETOB|nr:hypothetical protein OEZ85_012780 [Tetradesmus obliquus]
MQVDELHQGFITGTALPAALNATVASAPQPACSRLPGVAGGLLQHNGRNLFLTGVNLGDVQFLPFEGNQYGLTADALRSVLDQAFAEIAATGANSVRFWLHIDGRRSPSWGYDQATGQPMVLGLPSGFMADLKWLLSTAYQQHGLLLSISLWSHDVLAVRRLNPEPHRTRAILMMSNNRATDAYIGNALLPMIKGLQERMQPGGPRFLDAVVAFEVLNEPEGMSHFWRLYKNYHYNMSWGNYSWGSKSWPCLSHPSRSSNASLHKDSKGGLTARYRGWHFTLDDGEFNNLMYHDVIDNYPSEWDFLKRQIADLKLLTTQQVPHTKLLRFVNRVAGAIKRAAPGTKVTVGAHSMPYNSDVAIPNLKKGRSDYGSAPFNYWKDSVLVAAGGDPQGVLDFYSVHGYPIWACMMPRSARHSKCRASKQCLYRRQHILMFKASRVD